jgi:integrase
LAEEETRQETASREGTQIDIKGKIVEFLWQLQKDGLGERTIEEYGRLLKRLVKLGANLHDPETVKDIVARQEWATATKILSIATYHRFASTYGIQWKPPKYRIQRKLPFIPLESEVDSLVAACGKKVSTMLQLLKETGARVGEALALKWIDVDLEHNTVTINEPEKGGNPRQFKVSNKLVAMINALPKENERIFGNTLYATMESNFCGQRKRASAKLQNPRLKQITFHTLRHWKATTEYHKNGGKLLEVMRMLGHKNIQNTMIYTHLVTFENDDYHTAVAKSVDEARKLIETGFEYVCTHDNLMIYRKRK